MLFEVMLQSLLNRCEVTGPGATIPLDGCRFDQDENRWMLEVQSLEHLRQLAGELTVALRFDQGPDPHLLIVEDDLDG